MERMAKGCPRPADAAALKAFVDAQLQPVLRGFQIQ
jgi:hypothetical protein